MNEIWETQERKVAGNVTKRIANMTPEPLFETYYMHGYRKICLICCNKIAISTLWSSFAGCSIVPMCKECASDWNFHGYCILKRITPWKRFWLRYKMLHLLSRPTLFNIVSDVISMLRWTNKMSRLLKNRKS